MFQVGDMVFYGIHGVCAVTEISRKTFCGKVGDYYTLKPVFTGHSTLFVPVDREGLAERVKPLLSKEQLLSVIRAIPDSPKVWYDNDNERKEKYAALLKTGTRGEIAALIKTLHDHRTALAEKGKKLHAADERVLGEAEKMFHEEIAYVFEMDREAVPPFIREEIGARA